MMTFDAPSVITEHLGSLVPILLELTVVSSSNTMNVRISALRCLGVLTTLKYTKLHPFKPNILRSLKDVLDDPKRLVRKEAVDCRNRWFVLSAPAE
ncbi:hypothetical protein BKA69DRAFT_1097816 [Paraphysoderma sedebokerense]|nr:hypothetical protein BKA69DRAFT_1097816 [Paraphysoderma sedebokerense]